MLYSSRAEFSSKLPCSCEVVKSHQREERLLASQNDVASYTFFTGVQQRSEGDTV